MTTHRTTRLSAFFATASVVATASMASAGITGGSTQTAGTSFKLLDPPPPIVGSDNQQNNVTLFGFDERQVVTLDAELVVDISSSGSPIPAGTTISSHYVFFDPANLRTIGGDVQFTGNVLGLITMLDSLGDSDFLGLPSVTYAEPSLRGLENDDSAMIAGPRNVSVALIAESPGDYIRVISEVRPGDANDDGNVDLADFVILRNNFCLDDRSFATGDFNTDGVVDLADFVILRNNFGSPSDLPELSRWRFRS